ncbi:MAG: hypothetical protein ACE5DO_07255 [Desulfobacterales bacterium]
MQNSYKAFSLYCLITAIILPLNCYASQDANNWVVSPFIGMYSPKLEKLNDGEFKAPLPGRGRLVQPDTDAIIDQDFIIDNSLSAANKGFDTGIEFRIRIGKRDSLIIGFSVWESESRSKVITGIPLQGVLSDTLYERTANISYFQHFIGWKRNIIRRPQKYNLYSRVAFHQLIDVDFKEKFVFTLQSGPAETFKRILVLRSQATGILMLQLGIGGEYFLSNWFSIGMEAGYRFGFRDFSLSNASSRTDFNPEDNITFKLPQILDSQGNIRFLSNPAPFNEDPTPPTYEDLNYSPLKLSFDGWNTLLRFNFYF